MCNLVCGIVTTVIGAALVVTITVVGYVVLPDVVERILENQVILIDDSVQLERFEEVPFALNFTVRFFNISNTAEVISGGVPVVSEHGPYIYKLYQSRVVESMDEEHITYRIVNRFEFDAEGSFPNREDDVVTVVNLAYNTILQMAESIVPQLMGVLNLGLNGIFAQNNSPIMQVQVRDLLFDGIRLCQNPGIFGAIPCAQVRSLGENAQNLKELEDGSLSFSVLAYKDGIPGNVFVSNRGLTDSADLGRIYTYNGLPYVTYWAQNEDEDDISVCNMLNGTDSGVFAPFIDREKSLYALNTDICRSVELRYQHDVEYQGIPAVRFSVNEWFLNNDEGCFCVNTTYGLNREDGCLLQGAMEMHSCVGAFMVLSYPHFLYADPRYRQGVIGVNPIEDEHRIFLDLEPNTGTVIRGGKRAQFNVFMRPVQGISATANLRTTLVPAFWIEEGMSLPEEFVDEIQSRLLSTLNLVDILVPIFVALCCVVFIIGIVCIVRGKRKTTTTMETTTPMARSQTKSS